MQGTEQHGQLGWPQHLVPGALRISRSSAHYEETIAFYRDVVGLPVITEFAASYGEDGIIFGLPGLPVHLEIVRAKTPLEVDPLDQIVFYLSGEQAVAEATTPLVAAGVPTDPAPHPYWAANDATVYLDPDGRRVVFAPWVFGSEPEPSVH